MRGLSGNEQARVLVMIDGVPVNKSDGGSVNWNLLDPAMVERIEVVKGPASSMYGSNAMEEHQHHHQETRRAFPER
jgi:iron complex outermembrane receptor protein